MRFSQLVAFCRVVELGSFTRAAEALVVTQPAVSLHVRSLEQELRVQLLSREGTEVVATPAGQTLYCHARTMLDARDVAEREISAMHGGPRETLTLGASATGMAYYLPPLLKSFMDRQSSYQVLPRVDITDRVVQWAADGRVDVGLVWGPVRRPDVVEEHLGFDRLALVCPSDHPLADDEEVTADSLAAYPFVLATQGSVTRRFVEGCLARVGVRPHVAAEFSATADMKRAVEAGLGIAVLAFKAIKDEVAEGRLIELRVKGLDLWRPVSLIASRQRTPSEGAAILAEFLAQELHLFPRVPGRSLNVGKARISSVRRSVPRDGRRRAPELRGWAPMRLADASSPRSSSLPDGWPPAPARGPGRSLPVDAAHTVPCPWRSGRRVDVSQCTAPDPCPWFEAVRLTRGGGALTCCYVGSGVGEIAAVDEGARTRRPPAGAG